MSNPFLETMQSHSDKKLKEIVESKRGDYQPEAIAAAEEILRKRNVKFAQAEPDEIVEMTYEEIAEDIQKRKAKGQTMSSIRAYYKDCGVDIDMREIREAQGQQNVQAAPQWNLRKLRGIGLLAGAGAAIVVNLDWQSSGVKSTMPWIIGAVAVIGGYFLFRKK